jgi:uncharacterized protein YjbI with pentapeptide repeats
MAYPFTSWPVSESGWNGTFISITASSVTCSFIETIFKNVLMNSGKNLIDISSGTLNIEDSFFENIIITGGILLNQNCEGFNINNTYRNITINGSEFIKHTGNSLNIIDCSFEDIHILKGNFINNNAVSISYKFTNSNLTNIDFRTNTFIILTIGSLEFTESIFKNIVGSGSHVVDISVMDGEEFNITGCTFFKCEYNGGGNYCYGAPFIVMITGNGVFSINDSHFINCISIPTASNVQALYVKANSGSDNFRFESIQFIYENPSDKTIILLDIPSDFVVNDEFTNKFINLCPFMNKTNFIINKSSYSYIGCLNDDIFVKNNGNDLNGCGEQSTPCKTISFAISRLSTGHYYEEMSIILLEDENDKFVLDSNSNIADVTLESYRETIKNCVVEVTESAWDVDVSDVIDVVFSISGTSSIRFLNIIFNLPSSSSFSSPETLPQNPFIHHSSS